MVDAIVGLGSNLGSREALLRVATRLLGADPRVEVTAVSPPYVTPPLGPPQPDYLNAAARLATDLGPLELLAHLQRVEATLGRVREVRWGPRTVDLDLLYWMGGAVGAPGLTVPHPGLRDRSFALAPLLDVAPELRPELGPVLAALGAPTPSTWSEVRVSAARVEVEAVDPTDALALALDAALGSGAVYGDVRVVEVSSAEELVSRVAESGRRPGWLVIEEGLSGAIRARFTVDPGPFGALRLTSEAQSAGQRARVVLDML